MVHVDDGGFMILYNWTAAGVKFSALRTKQRVVVDSSNLVSTLSTPASVKAGLFFWVLTSADSDRWKIAALLLKSAAKGVDVNGSVGGGIFSISCTQVQILVSGLIWLSWCLISCTSSGCNQCNYPQTGCWYLDHLVDPPSFHADPCWAWFQPLYSW